MAALRPLSGSKRWPMLAAGAALLLALAGLSFAVPSRGTTVGTERAGYQRVHGPVYSIKLPMDEPDVPSGPNREPFVALCRLCHSTLLVMTQPRFPEKKWGEVVHKMVAVYGAPIPPAQERAIVDYLKSVHGPEH